MSTTERAKQIQENLKAGIAALKAAAKLELKKAKNLKKAERDLAVLAEKYDYSTVDSFLKALGLLAGKSEDKSKAIKAGKPKAAKKAKSSGPQTKGRMSEPNKVIIAQMNAEGKSAAEIGVATNCTEALILNYIKRHILKN